MTKPLLAVAAWALAYLAAAVLLPALPEPGMRLGPLVAYLLLLSTTAPALHLLVNLRTRWYYLAILVPTFAETAALAGMQMGGGREPWLTLTLDLSILGYAYCAGKLAAKGINRDPFLLVTLFLVAAADLLSVLAGPARRLLESGYKRYFVLNYPGPGVTGTHYVLGFGDIFMLVLLLAYCFRNGLPVARTWRALVGTLIVVGVASWAGRTVLPALPFLSLSFLVAHVERFRATRLGPADRRLLGTGIAGLLAGILACALLKG